MTADEKEKNERNRKAFELFEKIHEQCVEKDRLLKENEQLKKEIEKQKEERK